MPPSGVDSSKEAVTLTEPEHVIRSASGSLHHPRRHAAASTDDYVFSQLIPYIGNKRKLLHLIEDAVHLTGCRGGTFVDLFTGSTVVGRWAKQRGFRVVANDWEPYSHRIALGTIVPNRVPAFAGLGGVKAVFETLDRLPPLHGYVSKHLCPENDDHPDLERERLFFTRENGERIDAIGERIHRWSQDGRIDEVEKAYLLSALVYAVSYASNTSGVFKGFHHGWGGKTGTALHRIRGRLALQQPLIHDNGLDNLAFRGDAHDLASRLPVACGCRPEIVYIDPPYNQHPYGSNYHVLNTVVLWDKPEFHPSFIVNGRKHEKSAIRKDWRTERRSPYNTPHDAPLAFDELVGSLDARWALVSYSTDGNIPLRDLLLSLARRGDVRIVTATYKRYRVSTPRMSDKPINIEFVAVVDLDASPCPDRVPHLEHEILQHEEDALARSED